MNTTLNPKAVRAPGGAYSHTVKVPGNAEWLLISGQIGIDTNGQIANGIRKQADQTFKNILACLKENAMAKKDLVKFTVYLTDSRFIADYRAARKRFIGDATVPTSTLLIIDGLAVPELLIEIEAWAAKS
jgi:enamine deaminase RidA (YjgF/YER057c/UK114 family)